MAAVQLWISIVAMVAFCASGFRLPMTPARLLRRHGEGHAPRLSLQSSGNSPEAEPISRCRRKYIQQTSAAVAASLLLPPSPASASEDAPHQTSQTYTRTPSPGDKFQFGYTITPPPGFVQGNKPLKTHLDEINFSPPDVRGYTLGITVDPVRIKRISEFGTPEEVAARVVTAEVNRDGVFKVTLAKDPREGAGGECYDVEYVSDGKRGTKRFATRIYVRDGFLYVLTVQSKESDYDEAREADVQECVKSFAPV